MNDWTPDHMDIGAYDPIPVEGPPVVVDEHVVAPDAQLPVPLLIPSTLNPKHTPENLSMTHNNRQLMHMRRRQWSWIEVRRCFRIRAASFQN